MRSSTASAGRLVHLVDDAAVGEEDHPVGVGGGRRVVGDHHDGLAELAHGRRMNARISAPARESRLPVGSSAKMISGRCGQRPGHGDALLLAAGELAGPVVEPVAQADGADDLVEPRLVGLAAGEVERAG